ncbi:unnamed protein product [Linum trigynum]|uniref:Uncharacterized protein n=1 Tax=Linum trigynum TaxID=586398 RepID=A0AAV2CML3_9ROSI
MTFGLRSTKLWSSKVCRNGKISQEHDLPLPQLWFSWLSLSKWWYNTNFHSRLTLTLFEALYGYSPSHFALQNPLSTTVAVVADRLTQQQRVVGLLRNNLAKVQNSCGWPKLKEPPSSL